MKEEDKKRLKDAFMEAVKKHPQPDTPMKLPNGQQVTFRQMVEFTVQDPRFFAMVEAQIKAGNVTLDQVVDKIKNPPSAPPKR